MLELGDESENQHAALAEILIAEKIDLVFTGGQYMSAIWEGLPREMRGGNASSAAGILNKVMGMIRPGDVVIVKGSAGSNTGPIVEALLELGDSQGSDPDDHKLVVNGNY